MDNIKITLANASVMKVSEYDSSNINAKVSNQNFVKNVVVSTKKNIIVSSNAEAGVINTNAPVTLRATNISSSVTELKELTDVQVSTEQDGYILAYQANTDSYVFIPNQTELSGDLDGGEF